MLTFFMLWMLQGLIISCIEPPQLDGNGSHVASGGSTVGHVPANTKGIPNVLWLGVKLHVNLHGADREER